MSSSVTSSILSRSQINIKYSCPYTLPILLPVILPYIIPSSYPTMTSSARPTDLPRGATYVSPSAIPKIVLYTDHLSATSMLPIKDPKDVLSAKLISPPTPDSISFPSLLPTVYPNLAPIHITSPVHIFHPSYLSN